ncbi:MAG TPA: glycosyltransferase family 4 protein [Usitatibacter sp.]|jgi:glycosyltransferase involved in cell wall biosynthesis|nr:glycosyltransferase family 4 protein [Usitatibacter sp.]
MRPLFITGSLVHGGAERHTITLANKLTERGHECHAAYVKNDPSQLARFQGVASVQCLHATRYFDVSAVRALASLMARVQPSSIVAANQYAMLYGSLARRWAGVRAPLTVTWHSNRLQSTKEHLQMLYYRPFFWRADCLVFVCEAQQRHWHARTVRSRRNEVIYNGVDTAQWTPIEAAESRHVRATLGFADHDYVIALPAVLRPEKNHVQLVDAIAMLRRRGVRARALMIGDGPMRGAVEQRARELGVGADIVITGFQQQVRPFLAACDTAVLTSFSEAFSLAAVEAMAMARPVVHSDVGGAPEMIRPGCEGYLYPVGDTAALVDRLSALADPAVRAPMGAAARETVEARFSELAMVDRYEKLLSELETSSPRPASVEAVAPVH